MAKIKDKTRRSPGLRAHLRSLVSSKLLLEFMAGSLIWLALIELVFRGLGVASILWELPLELLGVAAWFYIKVIAPIHQFRRLRPSVAEDRTLLDIERKKNELKEIFDESDFLRAESLRYQSLIEERFEEAKQEYLDLAKRIMVREVSGSVVHDLRNPLATIFSYIDFLREALLAEQMDTKTAAKCIDKIAYSAHWINRLVDRMSRFDAFDFHSKGPLALRTVVQSVLQLLERRIQSAKISLEVSIPESLPDVQGDQGSLEQVILNLLSNAMDAFSPQKPGLIRVTAHPHEEWVDLVIEDNGVGIPEENIEQLFKPFFTTKEQGKGTGLGLSIAHQIVVRHGGDLRVESRLGEGSRFTVRLKRAENTQTAAA